MATHAVVWWNGIDIKVFAYETYSGAMDGAEKIVRSHDFKHKDAIGVFDLGWRQGANMHCMNRMTPQQRQGWYSKPSDFPHSASPYGHHGGYPGVTSDDSWRHGYDAREQERRRVGTSTPASSTTPSTVTPATNVVTEPKIILSDIKVERKE
jgi:hypothetical protein